MRTFEDKEEEENMKIRRQERREDAAVPLPLFSFSLFPSRLFVCYLPFSEK